jgi:predicted helicase
MFAHVFVSEGLVDRHALDNASESMFVFPLFVYPTATVEAVAGHLFENEERFVNLAPELWSAYPTGGRIRDDSSPREIFNFAYAVFNSPAYRARYAEYLKIDFPRLPLTGNRELFRALARLGGTLTALHLLKSPNLAKPITAFIGGGNPEIEKISWSKNTVWIDKAQTAGFRGVPEDVWNFHIGGYQACSKWLKDRKGRTLSDEDIAHYQKIVVALSETIRLMQEIDEVIEQHGGWPVAFQVTDSDRTTTEHDLKVAEPLGQYGEDEDALS